MSLKWERSPDASAGWRRWLPWPHLIARDITIANPDWARAERNTAEIRQIDFAISPLALLGRRILIPTLTFDTPFVSLQRRADGSNNWIYKQSDTPSAWTLDLRQLVLRQGTVRLKDEVRRADISADIVTQDEAKPQGYGIAWKLGGTVNREKVSGSGKAGAVLSLQNQTTPYPIEADARIGSTSIAVKGTLTKPTELAALDMHLKLSGVSLAQLYRVTGIVLPETPPYATAGRLTGRLGKGVSDWTYENFSGKVGGSDLGGTLRYEARAPRPQLSGTVVSKLLQFSDLAPIIGADSGAERARRGEVKAVVSDGTISKFLLEAVGLNVGSMVLTKIVGDRQVKINCLASDFAVTSGLMQTRSFVVDTEESLVDVTGQVNLANEKLDLTINPRTKGARLMSASTRVCWR